MAQEFYDHEFDDFAHLTTAESQLAFAHKFGEDFAPESHDTITLAPSFLHHSIQNLMGKKEYEWWAPDSELAIDSRNRSGSAMRVFEDGSFVEIWLIYSPDSVPEVEVPDEDIAAYVDITAYANGSYTSCTREVVYELGRSSHQVVRSEITEDTLSQFDSFVPAPTAATAEDISNELFREVVMLRSGEDVSHDPRLEYLRATSPFFATASGENREQHANNELEKRMGLNHQPVGVFELARLHKFLKG